MPQPPTQLRDLALLIARIGVGIVFIAHGMQKFTTWGIGGTASSFEQMGIPLPGVSAWFAALVETLGGVALLVGVALPLAGVLLAVVMAGALFFAHLGSGLFAADGGYEYVLVLAVAALALGFNGGRYTLDNALTKDKPKTSAATVNA